MMINRNDYAIVLRCAEQYKRELADTKLLFVYGNRHTKEYGYFQAIFSQVREHPLIEYIEKYPVHIELHLSR